MSARARASSTRRLLSCAVAFSTACASINPTLAPARVLPPGRIAAELGSGYSAPLIDSTLIEAHAASNRIAMSPGSPPSQQDREALVRAAVAYGGTPPGVAGYVAARAGIGAQSEAQAAVIGRTFRVGVRRAFAADELWAFSLGVQGRLALIAGPPDGTVSGLSLDSSRLYGGDVTAAIGRTSRELYDVWFGIRAGYTHGDATLRIAQFDSGAAFDGSLDRFDVGATVGLRVGFGHLAAIAEIEADVGFYSGHASTMLTANGVAFGLVPAAALSYAF